MRRGGAVTGSVPTVRRGRIVGTSGPKIARRRGVRRIGWCGVVGADLQMRLGSARRDGRGGVPGFCSHDPADRHDRLTTWHDVPAGRTIRGVSAPAGASALQRERAGPKIPAVQVMSAGAGSHRGWWFAAARFGFSSSRMTTVTPSWCANCWPRSSAPVDLTVVPTVAAAKAHLDAVDCVLLDLELPDGSGLATLRNLLRVAAARGGLRTHRSCPKSTSAKPHWPTAPRTTWSRGASTACCWSVRSGTRWSAAGPRTGRCSCARPSCSRPSRPGWSAACCRIR